MVSLVLRVATRLLVPVMLVFSFFLLADGPDGSGGAFAGGLVVTGAYALYAAAFGVDAARGAVPFGPRRIAGAGLAVALIAGLVPFSLGRPFLEAVWVTFTVSETGSMTVGTPYLFDLGVYLLVAGASLGIILAIEEAYPRAFTSDEEL